MIKGQDHENLRDFFGRFRQEDIEQPPKGEVKRILLEALPEAYKSGCADMVGHWGPGADGTEAMSVRVLHVEAGSAGQAQPGAPRLCLFLEGERIRESVPGRAAGCADG